MAIVRKVGKGHGCDYFLTMTANADWTEIKSSLFRDANGTLLQTAADRPDLMARVFKMKMDAMLADVFEHQILGKVAAYAWTLEYQKRGMPHIHLLLIMDETCDKPLTARRKAHGTWAMRYSQS